MRKNMKRLTAVLAAAAMGASLAACGSADSAASGSTDEARDENVLVVATNAEFPPYEYYDGDDITGIDIEIAQYIADQLGKELQIEDMEFRKIVDSVQSGTADLGIAAIEPTEERMEKADFSDPYATNVQVIVVPEDSDIESADDLDGKLIGVEDGTIGYIYCADDYGEGNLSVFDTAGEAIDALADESVDCVVMSSDFADEYVSSDSGLKTLDAPYADQEFAIAVSQDDSAMLKNVNSILKDMEKDGTLQEIIDKYASAE